MFSYAFEKADHTVDAVIFGSCPTEMHLQVLLIERGREGEPFFGCWALPGGFINMDEDLETSLRREVREETSLELGPVYQLKTFGKPGRDPRGRVISTAFRTLVDLDKAEIKAGDDARKIAWFSVNQLPDLAFDHAEILAYALDHYVESEWA